MANTGHIHRNRLRKVGRIALPFTLASLGRGQGEGVKHPEVIFPVFLIGQRHFWRPYKHESASECVVCGQTHSLARRARIPATRR